MLVRSSAVTAGIAAVALSAPAHAGESRFEIMGYGGYQFGGSAEAASDYATREASILSAPSFGAALDIKLRANAFAELSYSRQDTTVVLRGLDLETQRSDLLVQYFQLGGLLEFRVPGNDWIRPVFGGTLGATVYSGEGTTATSGDYEEWRFSLVFEGGLKLRIIDALGIRLRARFLSTFLTDDSALFCGSQTGCTLFYSGTAVFQGEVGGGVYLAF
jgi:outer membrane protein with beta-barrel domain